ncbi:gamma-glutamylcyclotransferase family protein [Arundinibacter roseus]|uniref:Gamma-glutamylcyclotransferase n=1 Tax=Arundinibacter roseus TaxID=2070510 RepID=A0A4R4KKP1_9BACT|nr:gamma-glutamylcyclotransferase family protein [Arundinibacter roseus]TDB68830.1 gamma-glutamylcyclotransferase [Arundinibacter roseus]
MKKQANYLFVYGTLMRGFNNPFAATLRKHSSFAGLGHFTGELYRISWYPGALYLPKSTTSVHGEVYKLIHFETLIEQLDLYEEIDSNEAQSLYIRREVPVMTERQEVISCWTYLYNQPVLAADLIPSGRFTA